MRCDSGRGSATIGGKSVQQSQYRQTDSQEYKQCVASIAGLTQFSQSNSSTRTGRLVVVNCSALLSSTGGQCNLLILGVFVGLRQIEQTEVKSEFVCKCLVTK